MLIVRVYLVEEASRVLQHATTIAARYSAVRRQRQRRRGAPGRLRHAARLSPPARRRGVRLPLRFRCGAGRLRCVSGGGRRVAPARPPRDDVGPQGGVHVFAAAGVETCRLLCGGHGYRQRRACRRCSRSPRRRRPTRATTRCCCSARRWVVKQVRDGAGYPVPTPPPPPSPADALATAERRSWRRSARCACSRTAPPPLAAHRRRRAARGRGFEGAAVELAVAAWRTRARGVCGSRRVSASSAAAAPATAR